MKYSHRIPYEYLKDDVLFSRILEYTRQDKAAIDEIVLFFEGGLCVYQLPQTLEENAEVCKKRILQFRDAGVRSVGINVLATLGHKNQAWSWNQKPPFQTAVSPFGKQCSGQLCPRDKDAQEYIRRKYRAAISAGPDFLWVDDDLRVVYHEDVNMPCFCDRCVQKFNQIAGTGYIRESLVEALKDPANTELRKEWIRYNLDSYRDTCAIIRDEVERSGKKIKLGLMTVHPEQNTKYFCDPTALLDSLGAEMARPGGGFYRDLNLYFLLVKICGIAFQNAMTDRRPDICRIYELEDFPSMVHRKSVRTHITESTLAIMAGCDGIVTNSMPPCDGTSRIYHAFEKQRHCHEIIAERMRQTRLVGVRPAFSTEFDLFVKTTDFFYNQKHNGEAAEGITLSENAFACSGFVPYADPLSEGSWITILSGEMARALPDEEISRILRKSCILDGEAAAILCERGCTSLIGCRPGKCFDNGVKEIYTSHKLNGRAALEHRNTRLEYENSSVAYSFIPLAGAEPLTSLVSVPTHEELGTASIAFENELGGRCVIMGYDPWRFPNMWHREHQLHNIFEWLWNGHAPYTGIEQPGIFQLYRETSDRKKFMLMLTNTWEDDSGSIQISFSNAFSDRIRIYRGKGKFEDLPQKDTWVENGRRFIHISSLESHTFALIIND